MVQAAISTRQAGPLRRLAGALQRFLGVGLPVFGRGGAAVPVSSHYEVDESERAFRSNPWVRACVEAISDDLSGLPLVAERGVGVEKVQSADHWLLALLENPNPKVSGRRFRKQLIGDLVFGNAYVRIWRNAEGRPIMAARIPPGAISPLATADGEIIGWKLASGQVLGWADVLHIAGMTMSSDASVVLGASPITSLALGLQVDRDSRKNAGRAARRGKIEMMLSPKAEGTRLDDDRVKAMVSSYTEATTNGDGVYVVNTAMEAEALSLTARDGEFLGIQDRTQREILAVFGVPETRVGSPAANYGTAREQSRIYWSSLRSRAALVDDELSRLAEPGVRIRHSFAGVDALQAGRTEQQARAVIWSTAFGLSPADAARYEGFADLPTASSSPSSAAAPAPPSANGVAEPRKSPEVAVVATLQVLAGLFDQGEDPDQIATVGRSLLRSTLVGLGADRDLAEHVCAEAAAVCAETARAVQDGNLVELRAFGTDHARRILALTFQAVPAEEAA